MLLGRKQLHKQSFSQQNSKPERVTESDFKHGDNIQESGKSMNCRDLPTQLCI
jgi:hypothetical protein